MLINSIFSLAGSLLLFIVGLFVGSIIGGNYGFPPMFGLQGYESAGVFFALLGTSVGSLSMLLVRNRKTAQRTIKLLLILTSFIAFGINCWLYGSVVSAYPALVLFILLLPTLLAILPLLYAKQSKS